MSHWRGNMGELHDVMHEWSEGMSHLANVSQNVAIAAGGRIRGRGLHAMGATTSSTWDSSAPVPTDPAFDNVVNVTKQATGNVVYTYADGSVKIFNSSGQDVTANYIKTPAGTSILQQAALNANDAVAPLETAISNAATTAGNAASAVLNTGKSIITIAAILGVLYIAYKMDGKKS
jgi:hypothetical protein